MARRLPFRIPFFRIFYSTTYTSLYLVLLVLLAITPASVSYTAIAANAYQYLFMIGGVYVLTALATIFIYSSRLYTNRAVLAAVGKSWIPVEDGEVGRNVRKMIVRSLERSALIALESRPRHLQDESGMSRSVNRHRHDRRRIPSDSDDSMVGRLVSVHPVAPPWGHVEHRGWSSPSVDPAKMQPHIHYLTVVHELPNLIEAKAVSLASHIATSASASNTEVVQAALQRPSTAGLREYLSYLDSIHCLSDAANAEHFLMLYEDARYSGRPLQAADFSRLMIAFARLLTGIWASSLVSSDDRTRSVRHDTSGFVHSASSPNSMKSRDIGSNPSKERPPLSIHSASPRPMLPIVRPSLHNIFPNGSHSSFSTLGRRGSFGSVLRPVQSHNGSIESSSSSSLQSGGSVIRLAHSPQPGQLPYEWVVDNG